jgi:regulator of RNase E activity RraA
MISPEARSALERASTATISSELLLRGIRQPFLAGLQPLRPDLRMVGSAFTLRYVPAREDVGIHVNFDNRTNVQRLAVEAIDHGDVLVIDARGDVAAASLGHILATRIRARGGAGIVTDGCLRDTPSFRVLDLPAYARAAHAVTSAVRHHPADMQVPIGCAGVLVLPGDTMVGDAEGVVVIPAALTEEVARSALEREDLEDFILGKIESGESIGGLYPPSEAALAEYQQSRQRL